MTPLPGALGFRQVTQTARWRLTKTWITDPARATVLARVKFESLAGKKLKLYVLADPAPGDDGDDDRGRGLVACDDEAATAVAAVPRLKGATSGYRGTASDPWRQLEARGKLRRYEARSPATSTRAPARRSTASASRQMTLAIGFGAQRARRSGAPAARSPRASPASCSGSRRAGRSTSARSPTRRPPWPGTPRCARSTSSR